MVLVQSIFLLNGATSDSSEDNVNHLERGLQNIEYLLAGHGNTTPDSPWLSSLLLYYASSLALIDKLAIARAVMNVLPLTVKDHRAIDIAFDLILSGCSNEDDRLKSYSFEAIEGFVKREASLCKTDPTRFTDNKFTILSKQLMLNWEHPNKRVSHLMVRS
jgi:hypothetical protein